MQSMTAKRVYIHTMSDCNLYKIAHLGTKRYSCMRFEHDAALMSLTDDFLQQIEAASPSRAVKKFT